MVGEEWRIRMKPISHANIPKSKINFMQFDSQTERNLNDAIISSDNFKWFQIQVSSNYI